MIFQGLLTFCFFGILISVWRQGKHIRAVGFFVWIVIVAAIFFVWHPDRLNEIAHKFGIGRGADLMLYMFFVWVTFELLMVRIKERAQMKMITYVVRALAIDEAERTEAVKPLGTSIPQIPI